MIAAIRRRELFGLPSYFGPSPLRSTSPLEWFPFVGALFCSSSAIDETSLRDSFSEPFVAFLVWDRSRVKSNSCALFSFMTAVSNVGIERYAHVVQRSS